MTQQPTATAAVLKRLRDLREASGKTSKQLEEELILGPGWIARMESGEFTPSLNTLLSVLHAIGARLEDLGSVIDWSKHDFSVDRALVGEQDDDGLLVHFPYGAFDARYRLVGAKSDELDEVLRTLRNELSKLDPDYAFSPGEADDESAVKTMAVAKTFLRAVALWPAANPSDLWWFIVSRAFCDPFNHPAKFSRLDLGQSWKRTGGWALEEILVLHYEPYLAKHGVHVEIATGARKQELVAQLKVTSRLEADKVDVFLVKSTPAGDKCFGVIHVKASFAERRTDDVPMSQALIQAGYTSVLWTMDAKSTPGETPVNRGELGALADGDRDDRSAKRKDIESDGLFSACFSYNSNTLPTPDGQAAAARVYRCSFADPNDQFSAFVLNAAAKAQ